MTAGLGFHAGWLAAIDARRAGQRVRDAVAASAGPGFDVYVNTGLRALADALQANHPSVAQRLGSNRFRQLALDHALRHPATDARLHLYGEELPGDLLDTSCRLLGCSKHEAALLSVLAELDRAWTRAHVAADAAPLDHRRWVAQPPSELSAARLRLAPATIWRVDPVLPIWDAWSGARFGRARRQRARRGGQAVLITRPDDEVLSTEIDVATCAFLDACQRGCSLAEAAEAATLLSPDIDLQALLARLFTQGAFAEDDGPLPLHPPAP